MNCRTAQRLLSAERDGALTPAERAGLDAHLAECAECRQARAAIAAAITGWQQATARVEVPDVEVAWQDIRREIRQSQPEKSEAAARRGWAVPALWRWSVSLGAAAALAAVLALGPSWMEDSPEPTVAVARAETARADFVEVAKDSSSMVYVDDKSGWLVVWAVDDSRPTKI